jgi:hypothetical protein
MGRLLVGGELSPHPANAIDSTSATATLARQIHRV